MESFSQLCNTAILRSGITGKHGIRDALSRLVVTLIQYKGYQEFTLEQFVSDFAEVYKLRITAMLFEEIVPELKKLNVIASRGKRCYAVNKSRVIELDWLKDFLGFVAKRDTLIQEFIAFSSGRIPNFTKSVAEKILTVFIEDTIATLGTDIPTGDRLNGEEKYLISSFIALAKNDRPALYETFENIMVGRMLASFITSGGRGNGVNNPALSGMTIYFDSAFILYLLGLDNYSTPLEYTELITALKDMGVKLRMFRHTFDEVYEIIYSTLYWINNYGYSWEKASPVNQYFLSKKATKEDVEEFLHTLESRLKKVGIIIEDADIDYNETDSIYQADIKKKIIDEYKKNGGYYEEKEKTYDLDAKSLYAIHKLRRHKTIHRFQDAKHLFVTTNRAIARVSKQITFSPDSAPPVPLAVTDTFMSVLLFFASPTYSGAINERFCIPAAFHAFEPDRELVRKVETVLTGLQKDNIIGPADAFAWKTSTVLSEYITRVTVNNPDNFDEATPDKIFELIQQDADEKIKRSEADSARKIATIQRETDDLVEQVYAEAESKIEAERHKVSDALVALERAKTEKKELSKELCKKYTADKDQYEKELIAIQKRIERRTDAIGWVITAIILLFAIVGFGFSGWLSDTLRNNESTFARVVSYAVSGFLVVASIVFSPKLAGKCVRGWILVRIQRRHKLKIDTLQRQIEKCDQMISRLSIS